jgi:hypothetical protein
VKGEKVTTRAFFRLELEEPEIAVLEKALETWLADVKRWSDPPEVQIEQAEEMLREIWRLTCPF